MEQTKALNALEPFLALSKSASAPRAAADLITQATSAPNTYVFAELLQTPNIQKLRESSDYASSYTLLEIFSWGTWEDYKCRHNSSSFDRVEEDEDKIPKLTTNAAQTNLPQLSPAQKQKLLLLSLLPLSGSHKTLTYPSLQSALDLTTTRELEQLITTAIYAGLISATLDPAHSLVSVTSVAPLRDLAPGSLPAMQATLSTWSQRCDSALADLEARVAEVKQAAVDRERMRRKKERALEVMIASSEEKGGSQKRGVSGLSEEDMMDIDQENGGSRVTRGSNKRGPGSFGGSNFLGRRLG
jgi:COP9 signalosome complex subunit 7